MALEARRVMKNRWGKQIAELLSADLIRWCHDRLQPANRWLPFADEATAQFV